MLLLSSAPHEAEERQRSQQGTGLDEEIEEAGLLVGEFLASACGGACVLEETGRTDTTEVAAFSFSVSFLCRLRQRAISNLRGWLSWIVKM